MRIILEMHHRLLGDLNNRLILNIVEEVPVLYDTAVLVHDIRIEFRKRSL